MQVSTFIWAFVLPFESDVTTIVVFSAVQVSLELLKKKIPLGLLAVSTNE